MEVLSYCQKNRLWDKVKFWFYTLQNEKKYGPDKMSVCVSVCPQSDVER